MSTTTAAIESRATSADLADRDHHEVVGGEVVQKAAPSFEHGDTQGMIYASLVSFRGGSQPGGWWLGTEVEIELERHEVYLPDVAGWRIDRVPQRPSGRPIGVAPDWVCEVLSPSTAARDLGHKQRAYHRTHVGHLWIVDPVDHVLAVYRWTDAGYLLAQAAGPGEVLCAEPFEAVELAVSTIFGIDKRPNQ